MTMNLLASNIVPTILLWVFVIGAAVALWFFSKRSQQKREEEINKTLNAIQPGNKVKTIGGIMGTVVELCPDEDAFILETGSDESGKSYIKFDKKAVYTTDAVPAPAVEEPSAEESEVVEEAPFEEGGAPVEETEEVATEETEETAEETVETEETKAE